MSEDVKPARSGKKGCCLFGCAGVAMVVLALLIWGTAWIGGLSKQFAEAEELKVERQRLEAQAPFVPSADGRVRPERLDAFLRVRNRLRQPCDRLEGFFGAVKDLEAKERGGEEASFMDGLGIASAAFQVPGMMADYFEARNRALVDEQMGLDEWRWYTMLAYRTGGGPFRPREEGEEPKLARGSGGDRELMRRLLVAQLEAARVQQAEDADWLAQLEAEVARLEDAREWPWSQGLPARVRDSLASRDADLRLAFCEAAQDVEFEEVQQDGLTVRVD